MLLTALQEQLSSVYETPIEHCVVDFLITDARLARALDHGNSHNHERLLLRQSLNTLDVSLYIDVGIITALSDRDPLKALDSNNLNAFLIALEGVSHFNYVLWNARHDKQVTRFELELQAEVDKFVAASMVLAEQGENAAVKRFQRALFADAVFDPGLDARDSERYREANHYAGKYCEGLRKRFPRHHREPSFINEIRRFYRLTQNEKIRYIQQAA